MTDARSGTVSIQYFPLPSPPLSGPDWEFSLTDEKFVHTKFSVSVKRSGMTHHLSGMTTMVDIFRMVHRMICFVLSLRASGLSYAFCYFIFQFRILLADFLTLIFRSWPTGSATEEREKKRNFSFSAIDTETQTVRESVKSNCLLK